MPTNRAVQHTSASNGGFDQTVEFLVTADGQLKVTRSDTFHLQILAGIASQFQHLHHTQQR